MTIKKNIYINATKQEDFDTYLVQRLTHFLKMHELDADVNIGSVTSNALNKGEYSVFFIDSEKLAYLNRDSKVEDFISANNNNLSQIIIVLYGIEVEQLPKKMQECVIYNYPLTEADGTAEQIQLKVINDRTQVNNSIFDVLQFIFPKLNTSSDILRVFVGPYNGNARQEYHKVMRELRHRGYKITDYNTVKNKITSDESLFNELKDINTSIHFLSHDSLRDYPHTSSIPVAINKKTSEFCKTGINKKIKRIIYIPPVMPDTSDEIIRNIDLFKRDTESLVRAEIIQSPTERLKGIVLDYLQNKTVKTNDDLLRKDKMVYFIFPLNNKKEAMQIIEEMDSNNINVCYPDFELNRLELLKYHQNCLKNCTGVLIYNSNNSNWLIRKVNDVLKAPGWGRKEPILHKFICGEEIVNHKNGKSRIADYEYIGSTADKKFIDVFHI